MTHITWTNKRNSGGYEVSSVGDNRFSALFAKMPDGRTIEQWYQCDIKGYDMGGRNWKLGKGKPPVFPYPYDQLWEMYLSLWRIWAIRNEELIFELYAAAQQHNNLLSDVFGQSSCNQARALASILNDWVDPSDEKTTCSACGEAQFDTPSGISCPNGHGGADAKPI